MSVWNREGIPHKGWKCIDVIDVAEFANQGEPISYEQCGMWETRNYDMRM